MTVRDAGYGPSGMPSPDRDAFADVPDPAAHLASRPPPPSPAPPAEPSLTRAERSLRQRAGLVLAIAWVVALTLKLGLRPDLTTPRVIAEIGIWIATAGLALVIALHPGPRGLSVGVRRLAVMAAAVPAVFVACAIVFATAGPPLAWTTASGCIVLSTTLASIPIAIVLFLFRRSFATAAPWRLAVLGAASGMSGSIGCHAHCPLGDAVSHVVLAHGAPIVLGAVVATAFGAWRGRA